MTFSVILVIFYATVQDNLADQDSVRCSREIQQIISEAAQMYTYADEEANISLILDVPSSIQLLVFGGLPRNNSLNDVVHDEATSPNYFYMTDEGSIISGHAQVRFCGENDSCCATFLPGRYHVTLHLLMTPGGPYVAITT